MGIRRNKGRWTSEEHEAFLLGLRLFSRDNWAAVAAVVPTRTVLQVRTHAQKYFNKVDKGEDFPEEPYPSQYDPEAGKSGAAAGAYLYGVSHQNQPQLQQHQQEKGAVGASSSMELPTAFPPKQLGDGIGDMDGVGAIEPDCRCPTSRWCPTSRLIGSECQQQVASASAESAATAAAAAAAATGPGGSSSTGARVMVPPFTSFPSTYASRDLSYPPLAPITQGDTTRGARHRHAYATTALVGADPGAVRWSVGPPTSNATARFVEGESLGKNVLLGSEYYGRNFRQSGKSGGDVYEAFPHHGEGALQEQLLQQQQQQQQQRQQQQHQQHQQQKQQQQQQQQQQRQRHWSAVGDPASRKGTSDIDGAAMMNSQQAERHVFEDPVPFDGWLDTLLLDASYPCGDDDDIFDGNGVDLSAIDFGAI